MMIYLVCAASEAGAWPGAAFWLEQQANNFIQLLRDTHVEGSEPEEWIVVKAVLPSITPTLRDLIVSQGLAIRSTPEIIEDLVTRAQSPQGLVLTPGQHVLLASLTFPLIDPIMDAAEVILNKDRRKELELFVYGKD